MITGEQRRTIGSALVQGAGLVAIAAAITAWIFTRAGTPFAGFDWLELMVFHKHHYRAALLSGHLPLWNPYVELGRPFLADIETATLYPPNLLFLFSDFWALPLSVALHVTLILAGVRLLGRDLGLGRSASLLAGVTFALGAALSGRLQAGQIQVFCTLAYLPLWWALAWRAWRMPSIGAVVAFAVVTAGSVLAGSPPFFWVMGCVVAVWLLAWAVGQPWRAMLRGGVTVIAGGAAGLGLAAVQLVPFIELLQQGNRPRFSPGFADLGALPVRNLASLFVQSTDGLKFYWEMNLFAGVLAPLGLVALGFAWRDRTARAFVVTAFCGLVLALEPLGVAGVLASWLPGMGALRMPSRYAIAVGWSLAMVALLVWRQWGGRRPAWLAAGVAAAQIGSLLWAVNAQAAHYSVATRPVAEDAIAAHAAQLARAVAPMPLRVALARDAVRANVGVLHGFSNLNSFANPGLARVWEASHALAGVPPRTDNPALTAELALQPREALLQWGVQFGWDQSRGNFFSELSPVSRARAVPMAAMAPSAMAAAQGWWQTSAGKVFLEGTESAQPVAPEPVIESRALAITGYSAECVDVRWLSPVPGWLVLAELWYPGWHARIGDAWVDARPANGWMRAVPVPAGECTFVSSFFRAACGGAPRSLPARQPCCWRRGFGPAPDTSLGVVKMPPCPRVGNCP